MTVFTRKFQGFFNGIITRIRLCRVYSWENIFICLKLYWNCRYYHISRIIYGIFARIRYIPIAHINSQLNQIVVIFLHCSGSYPNRTWVLGSVKLLLCFPKVKKDCGPSSIVTLISNMFVVSGLVTVFIWMRSSIVFITSLSRP